MKILAVIPARGGSRGIPRKNVRILEGHPLIAYAIRNAQKSQYDMDVCVTTDDEEIARVATSYQAQVIDRGQGLAEDHVTLDPVIYDAYQKMEEKKGKTYDVIITLQATSPLLTTKTLDKAIDYLMEHEDVETIISVVNHPHLSWGKNEEGEIIPHYKERLNRQYLPANYFETGAFLITRAQAMQENSRIGEKLSVFEVPENEAVDIDRPQDWWVCENELSKKTILIRVEGYSKIGLGHVYRGLALAYGLIHHQVHFVTSEKSDLAQKKLEASHFPYSVISSDEEMIDLIKTYHADVVVNDMLNTSLSYMEALKELPVRLINFEDLGPGADLADAVINDLYAPQKSGNQYYWGSDYYVIRDEFLFASVSEFHEKVQEVLVIFGGVDPNNLSQKLLEAIPYVSQNQAIHFTIIVGPGYQAYEALKEEAASLPYAIDVIQNVKVMSDYMKKADLAISSQGRTMLELAAMGVPTVLMAQNEREMTHEFGYLTNGFMNLGLGSHLDSETIGRTLTWLMETPQIRQQMRQQMVRNDLRHGLNRVLKIILE